MTLEPQDGPPLRTPWYVALAGPVLWVIERRAGNLSQGTRDKCAVWSLVVYLFVAAAGLLIWGMYTRPVQPIWSQATGLSLAITGWILSAIILVWSVHGSATAQDALENSRAALGNTKEALENTKQALENTNRLLQVSLQHYTDFADHVRTLCETVGPSAIVMPLEVTLVMSSLAYGIQSRQEQGDAKGTPVPGVEEAFGALLLGWLTRWQSAERGYADTFHLRLCLWEQKEHRKCFAKGAGGEKSPNFDDRVLKYLGRYLRPFLYGVRALHQKRKLMIEVFTTRCDEVRVALVRGVGPDSKAESRAVFAVVTILRDGEVDEIETGNVKHIGFESSERTTFERIKTFAEECMHARKNSEIKLPQDDPDKFIEEWFGFTKQEVDASVQAMSTVKQIVAA